MKEYNMIITYSEELKRDVKVYVSLPKSYSEVNKSYPVLYLNDGQILFNDDEENDNIRSWGIMESYLKNPDSTELILVGIGSTKRRTHELLPFSFAHPKSGNLIGGEANNYMDFIVNSVKPIINKKYRTLTSKEHTGMLGISVGGVTSTFAATNYSDHFTIFGGMSSAYIPIREKMVELVKKTNFKSVKKMYLDVGTNESPNEKTSLAYVESNTEIFNELKEKIDSEKLKFEIIEGSQHSEDDWEKRLPSIIEFMFS